MKYSTSLKLIFLIQIAVLPLILGRVHPIPISPNDAKLIDETCSKTPVKDLCEAYVRSDKRSLGAKDARDLAFIMLAIVQVKATNTTNKIQELQQSPGQPQDVLASCLENCNVILEEDAPQCSGAIQDQDFLTAEDRFRNMYHEINLCNEAFGGSANPLAGLNQAVRDSATVGAEIVATLV